MLVVVVTCEHGGNLIPSSFQKYFINAQDILASHEGWDIGALQLAGILSQKYSILFCAKISRLLIDLNRSLHHPKLFSKFTRILSTQDKQLIIDRYYQPYRDQVREEIKYLIQQGKKVLHLSVHSFTPELNGIKRTSDIGFLYDPARNREKKFCVNWKKNIYDISDEFRVRMNYPYLGKADGFVTALREEFSDKKYIGIELEVNQNNFEIQTSTDAITRLLLNSFEVTVMEFEK